MDTITHGIAGLLIGKSFFSEREGRSATLALTFSAVFPDSDSVVNLLTDNRITYLEVHRGITHSLIALPLFALLLGVLTSLAARRRRKWLLYSSVCAIGLASHILFDLITSFGTMVWSPLSNTRVAWDMIFIVDAVFTSILLLPQLIAWAYSDRRKLLYRACAVWLLMTTGGFAFAWLARWQGVPASKWSAPIASLVTAALLVAPSVNGKGFQWSTSTYCRTGLITFAIYLGMSLLAHQAALARVEEFAAYSGVKVDYLAALPSPPSLLHWSALVQSSDGVYRSSIDLTDSRQPRYQFFHNAEDNPFVQAAAELPDVKTYFWFARFPWVTYYQNDGLHVVVIRDIQFYWPARGDRAPFTLRISLDSNRRVISSNLLPR